MLFMVSTLSGSTLWLVCATIFSLPISGTHAVIGSAIGVAWLIGGLSYPNHTEFGIIGISWLVSPIFCFIVAAIFWIILKKLTLTSSNPGRNMKILFPFLSALACTLFTFFIVFSGSRPFGINPPWWIALVSSLIVGVVATVLLLLILIRIGNSCKPISNKPFENSEEMTSLLGIINQPQSDVIGGFNIDPDIGEKEENEFEPIERSTFGILVLITTSALSMSHGANDIANAAAPFIVLVQIYQNGSIMQGYMGWVVIVVAIAVFIGLITFGHRLMTMMGSSLARMTSARVFVIQFTAATTSLSLSAAGIPISTSMLVVFALFGVSIVDVTSWRDVKNVQWKLMTRSAISWALTIPVSALTSMGIYGIITSLSKQ